MKKCSVAVFLGCLAYPIWADAAPASPPPVRGPASFAEFDASGDGKISEQEFNEGRARRMAERARQGGQMRNVANAPTFAQIDANGDGVITPDEFSAHRSGRSRR